MTDFGHLKPVHGYWVKYYLPRPPKRKRNKIDTEEQLRFEKLQSELFRIMNGISQEKGKLDGFHSRISVACKRRNGKLYIRLLYDNRYCWSLTDFMVDLHKKVYKSGYPVPNYPDSTTPRNDGTSIEDSEFYNEDIMSMIMDFIEYSELKSRASTSHVTI